MADENNKLLKTKITAKTSKYKTKIQGYIEKYLEIVYNIINIIPNNFYWLYITIIIEYFQLFILILDEAFFSIWNKHSLSIVVYNYIKYINIPLFLKDRKILYLIILNAYILITIIVFIWIIMAIFTNKIDISNTSILIRFLSKFLGPFAFSFFGITFFLLISIFLCDQKNQISFYDSNIKCKSDNIFKIELPFTIISIIIQVITALNYILICYKPNFIVEENDLLKKSNSYSDIIFLANKIIIIILYLLSQGNSNSNWGIIFIIFIVTGINTYSIFVYKSYENKSLLLLHKFLSICLFWVICSLIISMLFNSWNFDGGLYLFFFGVILLIFYFFYKTKNEEILKFYCIDFNYIKTSKERLYYIKQYLDLLKKKNKDRSSSIIFQSLIGNKEDNCVNPNCKLKQYLELSSQGYESNFMLLQYCQELFESSIAKFPNDITLKCNFIIFLIVYLNKKKLAHKIFASVKLKQYNIQDNYIAFFCKKYIEKCSQSFLKVNDIQINKNILNASEYKNLFKEFLIQIIKASSLYLEFWSSLLNYYLEGTENFGKLNDLALDITSICNEINENFERLFRVKSDDFKVINLYSSFIRDVINDEKKYNDIKNMVFHFSNNIKIDDRKVDYCNFDLKILSDNDEYRYLLVSASEKSIGNIVDVSLNSCSLFGYTRSEIIGKSINLLIPEIFHRKHNKLMEKYCENIKNKFYENLYLKTDYKPSFLKFFTHGRNKSKYLIPLYLKIFLVQTEDSDILIVVEFERKEDNIIDNHKFLKSTEINLNEKNLDDCICILTDPKFIIQSFTPNSIEFLGINSSLINSNYNITQYIKEFQEEIRSYSKQPSNDYNNETSDIVSKNTDNYGSSYSKKNENEKQMEIPIEKQIKFFTKLIKIKYNKPQIIAWKFNDGKIKKEYKNNNLSDEIEMDLSNKNKNKSNNKFILEVLPSEISGKLIGYKFYFQKVNDINRKTSTKINGINNNNHSNFLSPAYYKRSTKKIRYGIEHASSSNPDEQQKLNCEIKSKFSSAKSLKLQENYENDISANGGIKIIPPNEKKSSEKFTITENFIPDCEYNFVLDINTVSYRLEKEILLSKDFTETLKEISMEKIRLFNNKTNQSADNKEYISFTSSSHSSESESSSSSNTYIDYNSSSSTNNNNNTNTVGSSYNNSNIKNSKIKIRDSNHVVKKIAHSPFIKSKLEQFNGFEYYKVENLNKIRFMIFDFEKEMIVDSDKNEKRPEVENIIYNYKCRMSSNLNEDLSYPIINLKNTQNKQKSEDKIDEQICNKINNNNKLRDVDLIKDINSSINKNEKESIIIIFLIFSCVCVLILLIISLLIMFYIISRRTKIKSNMQLIVYTTKMRYYLANSVYYVRELTLLNLNYYTKNNIGNYTKIPSKNKTEYIIKVGKKIQENFINLHDTLGLIEKMDFTFTQKTHYYLFEEPHTIKIANNPDISKNVNISLVSSFVQISMALNCLCIIPTKIKQNSEDLLNFMHNTLNEVGKCGKNLIGILLEELRSHFNYDIKLIILCLPINMIIHIAVYFLIVKLHKLSLNKKTSYLAVFYGIEYNLIQNSVKKCEKYLNKIKKNDCMYINNIKNDSVFDDNSSSNNDFEDKKTNKFQKIKNNNEQNNNNGNTDIKQLHQIKIFKIQFSIFLVISCLYLYFMNYLHYRYISRARKLANYNYHMQRFHNGLLNLYNCYREFLFDSNSIIYYNDSYNTLINLEQILYDESSVDISYLNVNYTQIQGFSIKYIELINRDLCSFKSDDYLTTIDECNDLMDEVTSLGFYNLATFLIEEIRIHRNIAKSFMDNNKYVGNLTRFNLDVWNNESLGLNKNNETLFRSELFNDNNIHSKMNILFSNIILPFIEKQKNITTESILANLITSSNTNSIMFLIYFIILGLTFFFYWLPMINEINNTISKTKNMLSIIPVHILSEQANIKAILNIHENN